MPLANTFEHYTNTFSVVSKTDSFRIILAIVTLYDIELNQMDVETIFFNGNLYKEVFMDQTKGFVIEGKECMVCKLRKLI